MIAALFRQAVRDRPHHPAVCALGTKEDFENKLTFIQLNYVCDQLNNPAVYVSFNSTVIYM